MKRPPRRYVVDTNVPVVAGAALGGANAPGDVDDSCILACMDVVEGIMEHGGLVIDAGDEILDEYRRNLPIGGQSDLRAVFMKWVGDMSYRPPYVERVAITPNGDSYEEFPEHEGLTEFDPSDRKFVAVANAHPDKPPILEATDSKWWGWREALAEVGITVQFLCPIYAETKYKEKMEQ